MLSQHSYLRVGNHKRRRYLSLQRNPWLLAWSLYWYGKPLGFRRQGIRNAINDGKHLLLAIIELLYYCVFVPSANDVIELPVSGDLCLKVNNGYKVIDLRRRRVVKIFSADIGHVKIREEIQWTQRAGVQHLAPTVRRWNIEERWYEEDYVNGHPLAGFDWMIFLHSVAPVLIPLLGRMLFVTPPREAEALDYARRLSELVKGEQSKLCDKRLNQAKVSAIRDFVDGVIERLQRAGDRPIYLMCSHGDFTPSHVLMTEREAVIIDWEAARYRSALFDLHHMFFRRLWGGGVAPGIADEMNKAITQLQAHWALHAPAINSTVVSSLDAAEVYRWIYYIERLLRFVERKTMKESNLDKILVFIQIFQDYEERGWEDKSRRVAA